MTQFTTLFAETWEYLSEIPAVQEWDLLHRIVRDATRKEPRHWRLPALAYRAVGGQDKERARAAAAVGAVGCLYLGIILIDDMLDADPRGYHTELGYPATANLASALQAAGLEAITRSDASAETRRAVIERLNRMAARTALGQYWDAQNLSHRASGDAGVNALAAEEAYWRIVAAKSSPFFGAAFYTGARMGGADEARATQVEEIGQLYGEMIQLYDDLNDTLEVPANPDWLQKRSPLPILFAEVVTHPERARFRALRKQMAGNRPGSDALPGALAEAQEILIRCGAISYAIEHLLDRHRRGLAMLDIAGLAESGEIRGLMDHIVQPVNRLLAMIPA